MFMVTGLCDVQWLWLMFKVDGYDYWLWLMVGVLVNGYGYRYG